LSIYSSSYCSLLRAVIPFAISEAPVITPAAAVFLAPWRNIVGNLYANFYGGL